MSNAWMEIVNADGSDEWLEMCSAALLEVQTETRRRMAAKVRLHKDEARGAVQATKVVDFCADLIDPDKED